MKENERKMKGKWKEHKRKMKGKWKENERKMKGKWKKMKGKWKEYERKMKGKWKIMKGKYERKKQDSRETSKKQVKAKGKTRSKIWRHEVASSFITQTNKSWSTSDVHDWHYSDFEVTLTDWHWLDIDLTLTWHWQWFVVDSDIVIDIVNSHVTMSHWQFNLPETNQRFTVYRTVPRHFFQPKFIPSEASQDWLQVKQPSFRQCNICAPQHHLNIANFNFQSPTSVHTASNT